LSPFRPHRKLITLSSHRKKNRKKCLHRRRRRTRKRSYGQKNNKSKSGIFVMLPTTKNSGRGASLFTMVSTVARIFKVHWSISGFLYVPPRDFCTRISRGHGRFIFCFVAEVAALFFDIVCSCSRPPNLFAQPTIEALVKHPVFYHWLWELTLFAWFFFLVTFSFEILEIYLSLRTPLFVTKLLWSPFLFNFPIKKPLQNTQQHRLVPSDLLLSSFFGFPSFTLQQPKFEPKT
jgi:hypothetical protein